MLCVLHVILFHESCHMFIYMYLLMHLVGVFFPSVIVYRWFLLLASYDGKTNLSDSLPFKIQLFFYKLFLLKSHLFVCCKKKKMLFTDFTISIHQRQKIHITFPQKYEAAQLLSTFIIIWNVYEQHIRLISEDHVTLMLKSQCVNYIWSFSN